MGMQVTKEIEAALEKAQREGRVADRLVPKPFEQLMDEARRPATKREKRLQLQPASWKIELTLPCRVKSEANQRDHWAVRRKRFEAQAMVLDDHTNHINCGWIGRMLPLRITWTHIGRTMDSDNLAGAFKGLRDALAAFMDVDDGDERLDWQYRQEKGKPGCRLCIEKAEGVSS